MCCIHSCSEDKGYSAILCQPQHYSGILLRNNFFIFLNICSEEKTWSTLVNVMFCGHSSGQYELELGVGVSVMLLRFLPLVPVCVNPPRRKLIHSGDTDESVCHQQVSNAGSRQRVLLQHSWYPNNPRWLVSCWALPSFTPPGRSRVDLLFTSRSGYTCGWALASLVKPKRWPGILSFDPCLKSALVTRLHSHDWVFLSFFQSPERHTKSMQPTK